MNEKKSLEKAFKQFHAKKYKDALVTFDLILANEPTAEWIKSRVEQFKLMAQRKMAPAVVDGVSLKQLSFHMNLAEYDKAVEILDQLDLSEGDKTFLRAEMTMEQGNKEEAVELLKQAAELDEHNAGYALNSPSFAEHLVDEEFAFLRTTPEEA